MAIRSAMQRVLCALLLLLTAVPALAAEPLRVMTFNIRYGTARDGDNVWDNRKELVVETIRTFDPDLLGSQEVLAMQADFLSEHLSGYKHVGVGRDDGKRSGELSSVFYKAERFEPVDEGTFWLSETPDKPGSKSWDSSLPRIATWVKLRDREADGREICFLNTHWDHIGNRARTESGGIIRRWLNEHTRGMPVIVTGDFNAGEGHPGLVALMAEDGKPPLRDVYRVLHPEPGSDEATFNGFRGRTQGRRIDFIFASLSLRPVEAQIDRTNREGRYPSDHFPVTAVLEYAE